MKTLYMCYFGLLEPLVQGQVLPYLRELASGGIEVHLLTFEPRLKQRWSAEEKRGAEAALARDGIHWSALAYHKRPSLPATLYDVAIGAAVATRIVLREKIDVVHARSHIPALMGLLVQQSTGCGFVFDVRGLMAEEYVDAGVWRDGSPTFRAIKQVERTAMRRADQLVVLTHSLRDWLGRQGWVPVEKIHVIPCCVDLERGVDTAPSRDGEVGAGKRLEVVYAGSTAGLYLVPEMARFFAALRARRPNAHFRVLTRGDAARVITTFEREGLPRDTFTVAAASPAEVPRLLGRASIGVSFRKPAFSQIAASPTKIPEYLAAGLPVVCNGSVGDMDALVTRERVGVVVRDFSGEELACAADGALRLVEDPTVADRCRRVAREHFDLRRVGGPAYRRVYERLAELRTLQGKM